MDISDLVTAFRCYKIGFSMNFTKRSTYTCLAVVFLGILTADYLLVSATENAVQKDCETKIAYDKSGSMFCVAIDQMNKTLKVSQR